MDIKIERNPNLGQNFYTIRINDIIIGNMQLYSVQIPILKSILNFTYVQGQEELQQKELQNY